MPEVALRILMYSRARTRCLPHLLETFCVAVFFLCSSLPLHSHAKQSANSQSEQSLHFELPANGNLRVENLRGGVIAEVWSETYVAISSVTENGDPSHSPAVIQSSDSLLTVRVSPAGTSRVNLVVKIPNRTHAAILTRGDSVHVRGLPAALLVQTIAGEIRVELPMNANARLVAESGTGRVSSSVASVAVNQTVRPQLQTRIGDATSSVRLISRAGNIAVATIMQQESRVVAAGATREIGPAANGSDASKPPAGTPASSSNAAEEVSEGDVIRVDTQLVNVNVSVVDRGTNRGINDLTKNDFRLYENNVEQQIINFDSTSAPFNLVLLVDLSGSTTKIVDLIKSAARHFVEAARPFDRIAVITFAGSQVVVSPLTTDHDALRQRINAIERPDGSTKLYDSLSFAMDEVFREARDSRRNAIVVISDGLDSVLPNVTGEGSKLTYDEVLRQAKEFDGVIYSIWTDTQSYEPLSPKDIQQETFDLAHDQMKQLADEGGGTFYECEKLQDLAGAYDRVVADLGMVYTLAYRPSNKVRDGSWRAIRVNVNRQDVVARGKRGYYAK